MAEPSDISVIPGNNPIQTRHTAINDLWHGFALLTLDKPKKTPRTTFASEADFRFTAPDATEFTVQNPGPGATFTTFDYSTPTDITGTFAGGVDPAGSWQIEFFESFDDGGVNSQSSNVDLEFLETEAIVDTDGVFSLGAIAGGGSADSLGELALSNLFDLYTLTLSEAGFLDVSTDVNAVGGFTGNNIDTEIAIFDSSGILLDSDDDGGNGTYKCVDRT